MKQMNAHLIDLVHEAALRSFWRKKKLKRFLATVGVPGELLGQLSDEDTKREWLDRLLPVLSRSDEGKALILSLARTLATQEAFPDLKGWEDSEYKLAAAKSAIEALSAYLEKHDDEVTDEHRARSRAEAVRQQAAYQQAEKQRAEFHQRRDELAQRLGTQEAGYEFQDWFYDLMDFQEVQSRRPYNHGGRQIDGSVTIEGTTYLVELKFTTEQATVTDIDSLLSKVNSKADNTMGIMVSISGYSSVAVSRASFARTPLLLLDHSHVHLALSGTTSFAEIIARVRRHASQTGEAWLQVGSF